MNKTPKETKEKRDGFYMNINSEEREIITKLQEQHAINISWTFKLFLKQLLEKVEKL